MLIIVRNPHSVLCAECGVEIYDNGERLCSLCKAIQDTVEKIEVLWKRRLELHAKGVC